MKNLFWIDFRKIAPLEYVLGPSHLHKTQFAEIDIHGDGDFGQKLFSLKIIAQQKVFAKSANFAFKFTQKMSNFFAWGFRH